MLPNRALPGKRLESLLARYETAIRVIDEILDDEYRGMFPSSLAMWETLDRRQAMNLVLELRAASAVAEEYFQLR